jgi:isopenicillin N synthase-like dioxygenase
MAGAVSRSVRLHQTLYWVNLVGGHIDSLWWVGVLSCGFPSTMLTASARRALARVSHARGRFYSAQPATSYAAAGVPVIDLGPISAGREPPQALVDEVATACADWGFFQVINHGVDAELRGRFDEQQRAFFALPESIKEPMRRSADNSRGWYNDELTKQRRDWKEGLDFGSTPPMDWTLADEDACNGTMDGFNRFPPAELLPAFRATMLEYYDALAELSARLTRVFSLGLGMPADHFEPVLRRGAHTSYLRLNYYPPCNEATLAERAVRAGEPTPLGISPHKDAGFLTVLQQDTGCHSLQVRDRGGRPDEWVTVVPEPDAFTINTGDMAQVWSNNRYHAPEHRVLTNPTTERYSAPFFYNPAYTAAVHPLPSLGTPEYDELLWGYFRAMRFAGDFADYGTEIQISDFAKGSSSWHVGNQRRFIEAADFNVSFDVDANRKLLTQS